MKKALVYGITGQDGGYLAEFLLGKGYAASGASHDAQTISMSGLKMLGIDSRINLISMAANDFRNVLTSVERSDPDEIYCLAGLSSVGLSFEQSVETLDSVVTGL